MKKYLIFILLLTLQFGYAQKVSLSKKRAAIYYVQLPTDPISNLDDRNFSITTDQWLVKKRINIIGFTKLENGGSIQIKISNGELLASPAVVSKSVEEKKDKNGKVLTTSTFYQATKTIALKGKWSYQKAGGPVRTFPITIKKKYESKKSSSHDYAKEYFKNNSEQLTTKLREEFHKKLIFEINDYINPLHGYPTELKEVPFYILDHKKNPDTKDYKRQLKRIREAFSRMKSHTRITNTQTQYLDDFERYFTLIASRYPEDKRKHRKMRFSCYYNLATLYYYFDQPDKAIEYAQKVIDNDHKKSQGKKIIKKATALKELFALNKTNTTHFPVKSIDRVNYPENIGKKATPSPVSSSPSESSTKKAASNPKDTKNPDWYTLSNDIDKDNKVIEQLIRDVEDVYKGIDKTGLKLPIAYIRKDGRITGKTYYSLDHDKLQELKINLKDQQISSVDFNRGLMELRFENNLLTNVTHNNGKYELKRSKDKRISNIIHHTFYGKIEKIDFERNGTQLSKITKRIKKFGKTEIEHIENTATRHRSIYAEYDKEGKLKIKIEFDCKLVTPKTIQFDQTYTYHTLEKAITKRTLEYTDFDKILKKYLHKVDIHNNSFEDINTFQYEGTELTRTVFTALKNKNLNHKNIKIYSDIAPKTKDAPEYEWKKGYYLFNENDELYQVTRDGKTKKKVNGIWTKWKK